MPADRFRPRSWHVPRGFSLPKLRAPSRFAFTPPNLVAEATWCRVTSSAVLSVFLSFLPKQERRSLEHHRRLQQALETLTEASESSLLLGPLTRIPLDVVTVLPKLHAALTARCRSRVPSKLPMSPSRPGSDRPSGRSPSVCPIWCPLQAEALRVVQFGVVVEPKLFKSSSPRPACCP
jgi:hypothetical protein